MVIMSFKIIDKVKILRFFEKNFLFTNFSTNVILEMLFFTLSNLEVNFLDLKLSSRTYFLTKVIFNIKQVKLIDKKEFVELNFDSKEYTYIICVANFTN